MISLKNKKALVTGATRGIGKEISSLLEEEGCKVIGVGRNSGDLSTNKGLLKVIAKTVNTIGSPDILINCAGIYFNKPIENCYIDDYERVFNINVLAPWFLIREFVPYMKKQKWGRIVNIGSLASYHGHINQSLYNASKHALLGMSRSLFKELNDYNIRVYLVAPGGTQTDMGKECLGKQDFNTFLDPKEVAEQVIFNIKFDKQLIATEIQLNRIFITRLEKII